MFAICAFFGAFGDASLILKAVLGMLGVHIETLSAERGFSI
jgi:hypothetical protein